MEVIKPGDLIGFSGYDWAGILINLGTYGVPYYHISHVGIIGQDLRLYESTVMIRLKCELKDTIVSGTQVHSLQPRIDDFWGKVYHLPLIKPLNDVQVATLQAYLMSEMGKGYDLRGALNAAGKIYSFVHGLLNGPSDKQLFCSEFCAYAHKHIDVFRTIHESKWSPNALIRAEWEQGVLGKAVRIK